MNRGSLLIVTLWIVTILGALSVAVARYLSTEVRLTRYRLARAEARELARSGVVLAQQMIQRDTDLQTDWNGEPWAAPQTVSPASGRRLTVTITDEERKLNVNTATSEQLTSLLGGQAAQAIADYVDAKDGPVVVLHELSDLEDLDETAHELLAAHATPRTGATQNGGPLNINTATREAMLALGLSEYTVNLIDGVRSSPNGQFEQPGEILSTLQDDHNWDVADQAQAGKEQALLGAMTTSSSVFLVVTEGVVEPPDVRVRIQAVLQRSTDGTAPKIIAWKEG